MNPTRLLRLQPLRAAALRQPAFRQSASRQTRPFHNSRVMFRAKASNTVTSSVHVANLFQQEDEQSAHTITQRIRSLKKVPPELLPLGVVILFALFAAGFAMTRKLLTDKTLRLHKNPPKPAH